jgi:hypothetical protein
MAEGESLVDQLAKIKAEAEKAEAQQVEVDRDHGEAQEINRENLLVELAALEKDFASSEKAKLEAELAIKGAGELLIALAKDNPLRPQVDAIIVQAQLDISKFEELNDRKDKLEEEIAKLDETLAAGGTSEKQEQGATQESAGLEDKIGSTGDMKSLLEVLGSVDYVSNSSGEKISTQKMIKEIENMAYMAPEMMKKIFGSREQIDTYLAATGVTRALGIRDKVAGIILDIEAMTAGHEASAAENSKESPESNVKSKIESATSIETVVNALRQIDFVTTTSGEKAKSSDMIATIRELYYMPSDISGDFSVDDIDKYLMNRGVTSELGIRGKAVELTAAEFSRRHESQQAARNEASADKPTEGDEAAEAAPTTPESPEATRRKESVEEVRERRVDQMAEEKKFVDSWQGRVYTEKGQELTIEEAKAKKSEIGKLDILNGSKNRSNINALLEAGLLTPEDIVGQFAELAEKSPDRCQDILLSLSKNVIEKLKLNDQKYEGLIGKLVKENMEYVDIPGRQDDIRALGLFRLPKIYELNQSAATRAGVDANFMQGGRWQAARDAVVASYDEGMNKGDLLLGTIKELPELMFDAVQIEWLNREQVMKWLKDSTEKWRGTANEESTISGVLELQEKGYISAEEAEELLK